MNRQCRLCNSGNIEILLKPSRKNMDKNGVKGFTPTSADFGIFHSLARCKNCGVVFSLLETNEEIIIKESYRDSKDNLYVSQEAERSISGKRLLRLLKNFIPEGSFLLDIGCSYGLFLKLARDSGLNVYGLDINEDACRYCRERLGLNVFCGDLKEAGYPESYFDMVTAIEVIEHLKDPRDFIRQIAVILKPGGILCLVTPNLESLSARLLGYCWWSYRRMHLYYFSKKTLGEFLKKNGFLLLKSRPYKKTFRIDYIIRQLSSRLGNNLFKKILSALSGTLIIRNLKLTLSLGDIVLIARKI